jgi:predicted nucleic-acid-binding Zn-ribbon protein
MTEFFKALKRAGKAIAASQQIHSYQIQGTTIVCPHCKNDQFDEGSALLNTAGMTFVHLDWANRSATVLVCKQCGYIQWFLQHPEKVDVLPTSTSGT